MPRSVTRDRAEIKSARRNRAVVYLPLSSVVAPLSLCLCLFPHPYSSYRSTSWLRSCSFPALTQEQVEKSLLSVQPVLRLIEDAALWPINDPGGNFFSPVRR